MRAYGLGSWEATWPTHKMRCPFNRPLTAAMLAVTVLPDCLAQRRYLFLALWLRTVFCHGYRRGKAKVWIIFFYYSLSERFLNNFNL